MALKKTDPRLLRRFGANVRIRREQLAMTQEVLAIRAGLHRTYVTRIEAGRNNLSLGKIVRLADALGTTASDLLDGVEQGIVAIPEQGQ